MLSKESNELAEKYSKIIGPLYFGCSAFIMFGVLMELFGLRSPLSDLNCDIVLGTLKDKMQLFFKARKAKILQIFAALREYGACPEHRATFIRNFVGDGGREG